MSWKSLPMWFRVFVIALLALFIVAILQDQIQKKKKLENYLLKEGIYYFLFPR